jgi:hypothetical protein
METYLDHVTAALDRVQAEKPEPAARPTETSEERARAIALRVDSLYRENPARWQERWAVAVGDEEEWHTRREAAEKRREEAGQAIRREREAIQAGGNATPHLTDPETQPGEGWRWEHVRICDPATGLPVVHVQGWMPPDTEQWSEGEWPGCNPRPSAMYLALAVLHDAALQGSPNILDSVTAQSKAVGVIVDRNFDDGAPPPRTIRECLDDLDGPFRLRCTQQGMDRAQTFLNAVVEDLRATGADSPEADPNSNQGNMPNVFRQEGSVWRVRLGGGNYITLGDCLGMHYLAHLIECQDKWASAVELRSYRARGTHDVGLKTGNAEEAKDAGLASVLGTNPKNEADRLLSLIGRKQANEWIERLERERDADEDPAVKAEKQDEINRLNEALRKSQNRGGQARKLADPAEKARQAVRKAVDRAMEKIKSNDRNLWHHLDAAVQAEGCSYRYSSSPSLHWHSVL